MKSKSRVSMICGLLMIFGFAAHAGATPISGQLNITGSASVSATAIDWIPLGGGEGSFDTVFPGTDYFSDIYNPVSGENTGVSKDLPAGPLPLANFLSEFDTPFERYDDLSFTLTQVVIPSLPVCTGAEAVGDSCVAFVGSPFILTRTSLTNTGVEFDVVGFFLDPTEGEDSGLNVAEGIYTANLAGMTPNQVRLAINAGQSIGSSYSAQYTATPIPEPISLTLLGTGLAGVALRARRRRQAVQVAR